MFDLAGFIRMRLENAGVLMIDDIGIDTYSDERFFSYRRSVHRKEPDYGRHVHAIALEAAELRATEVLRLRIASASTERAGAVTLLMRSGCGVPALDLNAF